MIIISPINQNALKNYYVKDYADLKVIEIIISDKTKWSDAFIDWITKFEVAGKDLNYQLSDSEYLFIFCSYGNLMVTVFIMEREAIDIDQISDLHTQPIQVQYHTGNGFKVW